LLLFTEYEVEGVRAKVDLGQLSKPCVSLCQLWAGEYGRSAVT